MCRSDFLAREDQMHCVARIAVWTVDETIDIHDVVMQEPDCFQGDLNGREVRRRDRLAREQLPRRRSSFATRNREEQHPFFISIGGLKSTPILIHAPLVDSAHDDEINVGRIDRLVFPSFSTAREFACRE